MFFCSPLRTPIQAVFSCFGVVVHLLIPQLDHCDRLVHPQLLFTPEQIVFHYTDKNVPDISLFEFKHILLGKNNWIGHE